MKALNEPTKSLAAAGTGECLLREEVDDTFETLMGATGGGERFTKVDLLRLSCESINNYRVWNSVLEQFRNTEDSAHK